MEKIMMVKGCKKVHLFSFFAAPWTNKSPQLFKLNGVRLLAGRGPITPRRNAVREGIVLVASQLVDDKES
jgi:hypothetical protein